MNLRRLLLFASTALTAAAMAAPAAAQAEGPYWYVNGKFLESEETFLAHGALSFTVVGFQIGPCETHVEGTLFNGDTMGAGLIKTVTITGPCGSNIPGCSVSKGTTNVEHNQQQLIVTAVEADELEIGGIVLQYHLQGVPCPANAISAVGTLKGGTFNKSSQCIEYVEDPDLFSSLGTGKVNGNLCLTGKNELK